MIEELKKQDNDSGYYSVANDVLLVLKDYCGELPVLDNYLFWKKTLYSSGNVLRYAFLNFVDVTNQKLLIFQFSCDEREILRYGAVYHITINSTQLSLIEGWCYLIKDGRPYGISKTEIEYIDEYLKEIKQELLEVI